MKKKLITPAEAVYWQKINTNENYLSADDLVYIDPDFIDRFVDYLVKTGVSIYAFQNSSAKYRAHTYNRWFKSLPPEDRQLLLF